MLRVIIVQALMEHYHKVRDLWIRLRMLNLHRRLSILKADQKKNFEKYSPKFLKYYKKLEKYNNQKYITDNYLRIFRRSEKVFVPKPNFGFLNNPLIKLVMFVSRGGGRMTKQLDYLERSYSKKELKKLLVEDCIGEPLLLNSEYLTSHNTIHHLYHLTYYFKNTGSDINKINTIIEWGGGYGNLAKLYKRLSNKKITYIMFDAPLFACVQWLYLATIFGQEAINLIRSERDVIIKGKINIIPINFREKFANLKTDLFISTWALSESGKDAQDFVSKNNWFSTKYLLLAFADDDFSISDSERAGKLAKKYGAKIKDIVFMPGDHYAIL